MNTNDAGMMRTTNNLATALYETAARLNLKAENIADSIEYRTPAPVSPEALPQPPAIAANDVLNRAIDRLLSLENLLDRIYESVGRSSLVEACTTAESPKQIASNQLRRY